MTAVPHRLALVLDPFFGKRLIALSARVHTWIVASPENLPYIQRSCNQVKAHSSIEHGTTSFKPVPAVHFRSMVLHFLGTIDLHRGPYSHDPAWSEIEVYGVSAEPWLVDALADFGVDEILPFESGFIARRSRAPTV